MCTCNHSKLHCQRLFCGWKMSDSSIWKTEWTCDAIKTGDKKRKQHDILFWADQVRESTTASMALPLSFGQRSVGCNIQKRLYWIFGWADRYSGWALNYTQTRSELISGKSVKRVSISWSSKHLSNSTTAKTQILNIVIYNRVHFNVRFFLGLSSSCKKK